jgi:REP element-mobilizing transposase RayT
MPRKSRIDAPGALHHIIARGIERRKIFWDDADRDNFLERLGRILEESQTACYAWALIPNHFHLLLRTGGTSISTVMRRLLTGYAVSFNIRHRRQGHLFQNRYKSILCQENRYLLELVRYIHLNPLRAKVVKEVKALNKYRYGGHSCLLGKFDHSWQDTDYILRVFGSKHTTAINSYRQYVQKGISQGKRADLVGGGLIRSVGGWSALKALRRSDAYQKGDERILGDGDFVKRALSLAQEHLERKFELNRQGYCFEKVVDRVAELLKISKDQVLAAGKYKQAVEARSMVCYWAARELGTGQSELARRFGISQPAVSLAIKKGAQLITEKGYSLT